MEYNLAKFIKDIKQTLYNNFPESEEFYYDKDGHKQNRNIKHKGRTEHIKDVALNKNNIVTINDDLAYFEIGNEEAERKYPYYHILQDAPVIHKKKTKTHPNWGATKKSKGSQASVPPSKRDYSIINLKNGVFSKEYDRNVRGARRSVIDNSSKWVGGEFINRESSTYRNVHYKYIDRILYATIGFVAQDNGLKSMRSSDSGLGEEYVTDNYNLPSLDKGTVDMIREMLGM